jgi:hypothetical protein
MKISILVRESLPTGFAIVAAAHAPLAAYLKLRVSGGVCMDLRPLLQSRLQSNR